MPKIYRKPKATDVAQQGIIYFIRAGRRRVIKIGYTARNPYSRLADLQTSHHERLKLLGVIGGSKSIESGLHKYFAEDRTSGEWFKMSARVRDFLSGIDPPPVRPARIYLGNRNAKLTPSQARQRGALGGKAKLAAMEARRDLVASRPVIERLCNHPKLTWRDCADILDMPVQTLKRCYGGI